MNPGTEEFIQKIKQVSNRFNEDGEVSQPATRYLTMQERKDREAELKGIDDFLEQPAAIMRTLSVLPDRVKNLKARRKRLKKELDTSSPPSDLSAEYKNQIYALQKQAEEKIRAGMLPIEDMRRAPVGAVDQNIKWLKATKAWQLIYKNCRRLLEPDSEDKDLANIESLRPTKFIPGGPSTFMGDAEAPGKFSYSHIPDEKWEESGLSLVNPNSPYARAEENPAPSATVEELQAKLAELQAKLEATTAGQGKKPKVKSGMSAEKRAEMSANMKKKWADKKAAAQGA